MAYKSMNSVVYKNNKKLSLHSPMDTKPTKKIIHVKSMNSIVRYFHDNSLQLFRIVKHLLPTLNVTIYLETCPTYRKFTSYSVKSHMHSMLKICWI